MFLELVLVIQGPIVVHKVVRHHGKWQVVNKKSIEQREPRVQFRDVVFHILLGSSPQRCPQLALLVLD
jgi:hypothetical protein